MIKLFKSNYIKEKKIMKDNQNIKCGVTLNPQIITLENLPEFIMYNFHIKLSDIRQHYSLIRQFLYPILKGHTWCIIAINVDRVMNKVSFEIELNLLTF